MMGLNFFISKTKQNWNLDPTFIVLQAQHPSALPLLSWDHMKWQSGLQIFKNWCPLYMTFTNVIWLGTGLIFALIFAHHTSNSCQNRWQHVERHDQIIFNPLIDRPHKCCPSKEMWMNKILSLLSCYSFSHNKQFQWTIVTLVLWYKPQRFLGCFQTLQIY
jgi:hypothetical protein